MWKGETDLISTMLVTSGARKAGISYLGSQSTMNLQVHLTTMPPKNALGGWIG
jgi:hypothetical protein